MARGKEEQHQSFTSFRAFKEITDPFSPVSKQMETEKTRSSIPRRDPPAGHTWDTLSLPLSH